MAVGVELLGAVAEQRVEEVGQVEVHRLAVLLQLHVELRVRKGGRVRLGQVVLARCCCC